MGKCITNKSNLTNLFVSHSSYHLTCYIIVRSARTPPNYLSFKKMATIPILGADSLSKYPSVRSHTDATLGSSRFQSRCRSLNKDSWLVKDTGTLQGVATRSVSVPVVPILRPQMRNTATGSHPRLKVLKSSNYSP